MKIKFSDRQQTLLKRLDLPFDINADLSDDEICILAESVADYLEMHGLDKKYEPTAEGAICESILDLLE